MRDEPDRGAEGGGGRPPAAGAEASVAAEDARRICVPSAVCDAIDTALIQVECSFTRGFAGLTLLGNTTDICRDGKERARAALEHLGIHIPPRRLVVSFTPADVKKDGNHLDLPVAVSLALLLGGPDAPAVDPGRWLFAAELGLAGELRPVKGVVSFAIAALRAGLEGLVVAPDNLEEVALLAQLKASGPRPLRALGFATLGELLTWLRLGHAATAPAASAPRADAGARDRAPAPPAQPTFDDMVLTPTLELAALTAAAGMHSLLLRGPPGTGKSMLAARLAAILPTLDSDEHVEAMRIYSCCSERLPPALLAGRPPYRAPHHQASPAAILGGPEAPGEMALAHGGVLFLDELPEFRRDLLEALREPLETGEIRISRSRRKVLWRARFILVAACNNCACGWAGSAKKPCICGSARVLAYRRRLSGPILDRIDLHVNVAEAGGEAADLFLRLAAAPRPAGADREHGPARPAPASAAALAWPAAAQGQSARLKERVARARSFGAERNLGFGVSCNRDLAVPHLLAVSGLSVARFGELVAACLPRTASSRALSRCLRVARTLADLDASPVLDRGHLEQAWRWQAERAAQERGEALDGLA